MNNATITCPNCHTAFEPNEAMRDQIQKELRQKMQDWQAEQKREFERKERDFMLVQDKLKQEYEQKIQTQRLDLEARLAKELEVKIAEQYTTQIQHLNQTMQEHEQKLKEARTKELEFLKKMQEVKDKEEELELRLQNQLLEERNKLSEKLQIELSEKMKVKEEEARFRQKELEHQLEQQKRLVEEMKRKAEQGSMQLQGEVQEILLEDLLRQHFPFDRIEEVGKGMRGGDCVQVVRNQFGQECGSILYESKRTKEFSNDWIEKVKADMRNKNADIALIVSQALPREINSFGEKDGVWICSFKDFLAVSVMLRTQILKVAQVLRNNENKTDKMSLLYAYLTGNEFAEQWKAIREGFVSMKNSIQKERDAMERLWKAREKQLEKILLNHAHIKGSMDGISGEQHYIDFDLDDTDDMLLLE